MTTILQTALVLLVLLQVKHLFADFFLQTRRMLSDRARILHLGRFYHAALHAAFSAVVFLVVGTPPIVIAVICGAELVLHYAIDLIKARHGERTGHGPDEAGYWRAFGTDQMAHQLTYLAMVWAWAVLAL